MAKNKIKRHLRSINILTLKYNLKIKFLTYFTMYIDKDCFIQNRNSFGFPQISHPEKKSKHCLLNNFWFFRFIFLRGNQHSGALFLCRFNLFLKCISAAAHVEISFKYVWYYNLLYEQIKLLSNNIYYLTQKKLKHVQCVLIVKTSTISLAT